jgi:hypothetical protein
MSQQPSFSELSSSKRHSFKPGAAKGAIPPHIGILLRHYLKQDIQPSLGRHLLLKLQDPFARNDNGGFRPNALWVSLSALGILLLSSFLYFNFIRS